MVRAASSLKGWPRTGIASLHHKLLVHASTCQSRFKGEEIDPACQWEDGQNVCDHLLSATFMMFKNMGSNSNLFFKSHYCYLKVDETSSLFHVIDKNHS